MRTTLQASESPFSGMALARSNEPHAAPPAPANPPRLPQDHDGSHIKGLLMNYFHHFYPSLLKLPGFLVEFITPIIKVRGG